MADLDDIRTRLDGIAEELADLAMDALRAAIERGDKTSPEERLLTRARRAVERAEAILAGTGDDNGGHEIS